MKLFIIKKSVIAFVVTVAVIGAVLGIGTQATANAFSATEKVIVIDAGHGGIDKGVLGIVTKIKESDINLSISHYLKGYFTNAGFKVVMTRKNQAGLYGLPTKGFKMRDMKKRKQTVEESAADMVISIHQNFCPYPNKRGGTVFFDKNSQSGKRLADSIQTQLNSIEENAEKNTALAGDYYMLKCTQNPSVIVECGFLSNSDDEALLSNEEYQKKIAYAVFKGAVAYYC